MKYNEKTLEYYEELKNSGEFDKALESNVGTGIVGSPLCGDVMKLQLLFDVNEVIVDAKYKVFGCVSAIAAVELVSEMLKGKTIAAAKAIRNHHVADELKLTQIKKHCSVLAEEAIEAAIKNYLYKKNKKDEKMIEINVSDDAIAKLAELILGHGDECIGVFIEVSAGGCSGVEYSLAYQMNGAETADDKQQTTVNNVTFFFEQKFELMIHGIDIDIVENSFGHGFVIKNAKNTRSCDNCSCKCS